MIGIRFRSARSMTLITFSAKTSPSDPPKTDASWLKRITSLPSILAMPVTTPSPGTRLVSRPKPEARCEAKMSISSNELRSTRRAIRSRAVSLPLACCRLKASASPCPASYLRWRSSLSGSTFRRRGFDPISGPARPSGRLPGPVLAEHRAQHRAALADRRVVRQRRLERKHQVVRPARGAFELGKVLFDDHLRSPRPQTLERPCLSNLVARADLHDLDRSRAGLYIAVDSHHDALTRLAKPPQAVGAVGDAPLRPAAFDACHRTAKLVHLGHDRLRFVLHPVGEILDVIGPAKRVCDQRDGCFVTDHLLGAQRKFGLPSQPLVCSD